MEGPDARAGGPDVAVPPDVIDVLWESAPVGLAFLDTELRYVRVNAAVLAVDGGSSEARLGRTLEEVHGAVGAEIAGHAGEVLRTDTPRRDVLVEGRLWHGAGPPQAWRLSLHPVHGPDGGRLGVGLSVVEVTGAERDRRELAGLAVERKAALDRYRSLVAATSAAVWIRGPDGAAGEDSPTFRAITGQDAAAYLGWGFLDAVHRDDRAAARAAWRAAVRAGEPWTAVHRLRTAEGYRWFRVRAVPVRRDGRIVEWVGTESDVDTGTRARIRLETLARATQAVNAALDPEAGLTALAESLVPSYADLCRVYLLDPAPAAHGVSGRRSVTRTAPGIAPSPSSGEVFRFPAGHPVAAAAHTGAPLIVADPVPPQRDWPSTPEMFRWAQAVAVHSMLVAPVVSAGRTVAVLMFMACGDRPRYTDDDLALVTELAARASSAAEQGERFQQARHVAVALQDALLTAPPQRPGVEIETRYVPAAAELEVGGDWYDVFDLPGGELGLAVGDVAGHDLAAATTMGQLRSMLRALAHDRDGPPCDVLARLDRVVTDLRVTDFTTLLYGRLRLHPGGGARLRFANAGHPPPLCVGPDGRARVLDGAVDVVLGVEPGGPRRDVVVDLAPGSTLLLYTDGLVERRCDPDDRGTAELRDLVERGTHLPLGRFCDYLVRNCDSDTGDDVALVALRL